MSEHIGSSLNEFLDEEGLLAHTEGVANKRIYDIDKVFMLITNLKAVAQQAIVEFVMANFRNHDMAQEVAAKFVEEILLIPARKYLPDSSNEKERVISMGIDFTALFGNDAERLAAKFTLLQLSQQNPEFAKFLKENPQYDQHNQSADTKD